MPWRRQSSWHCPTDLQIPNLHQSFQSWCCWWHPGACTNSLNLKSCLIHIGARTMIRIYRAAIRSKLDYDFMVCDSSRKSRLQYLDTIHRAALWTAVSPISSLFVMAPMPSALSSTTASLHIYRKLSDRQFPFLSCIPPSGIRMRNLLNHFQMFDVFDESLCFPFLLSSLIYHSSIIFPKPALILSSASII